MVGKLHREARFAGSAQGLKLIIKSRQISHNVQRGIKRNLIGTNPLISYRAPS